MYSYRALIATTKKNTNPICACVAVPSGADPTSIEITLRDITPMSTVMWC